MKEWICEVNGDTREIIAPLNRLKQHNTTVALKEWAKRNAGRGMEYQVLEEKTPVMAVMVEEIKTLRPIDVETRIKIKPETIKKKSAK